MTETNSISADLAWTEELARAASLMQPEIVAVRRHLHEHPELSMREFETTRYLADRVAELGLSPRVTRQGIGLVCDWQSAEENQQIWRVGLRGDIDALPIPTTSTAMYASRHSGVMHACGHDAHASMVWGALALLTKLQQADALPWPVAARAIFQPAEETSEGGTLMIESGALEGLGCVLALHVDPTLRVGKVAARPGPFTAACDTFDVEIAGRSGHSARPHLCADAIAAAASWISEMYGRVPRIHDCRDPAVVSVGTVHAGEAPNIVAGHANLSGTIRSFSESARAAIMQEMRNVAEATEKTFGCRVSVNFSAYTPSLHNDERLNRKMVQAASKLRDIDEVGHIELPSMGAEDFSFFAQQKPACMMRLGIAGSAGSCHALHTPAFDIDERALGIGAQLLAASTIDLCCPANAQAQG